MSESDSAVIGIQKCGCVTLAIVCVDDVLDQWGQDAVMQVVNEGGRIERTTVAGARRRKHFLPVECPHSPKGWVAE